MQQIGEMVNWSSSHRVDHHNQKSSLDAYIIHCEEDRLDGEIEYVWLDNAISDKTVCLTSHVWENIADMMTNSLIDLIGVFLSQ